MINKIVNVNDIIFESKTVNDNLLESIRKRGVAIPVRVYVKENKYICIDGHKRLSVLLQLREENEKFKYVSIMICNDFSKSGSGFWGNTKNHH